MSLVGSCCFIYGAMFIELVLITFVAVIAILFFGGHCDDSADQTTMYVFAIAAACSMALILPVIIIEVCSLYHDHMIEVEQEANMHLGRAPSPSANEQIER